VVKLSQSALETGQNAGGAEMSGDSTCCAQEGWKSRRLNLSALVDFDFMA